MNEVLSHSKTATIFIKDDIKCTISGLLPQDQKLLYDEYGYFNEGYFFNHNYTLGIWDGKTHFFSKNGNTYVELLVSIIPRLKKSGYNIKIVDKRNTEYDLDSNLTIDETYFSHIYNEKRSSFYVLEPHQVESVNSIIKNNGGIIEASTGAGKTIICATIVDFYNKQYNFKTITIVPSKSLVQQTYDQYITMNIESSMFAGSIKELSTNVIATWQTLNNSPEIVRQFDLIIVDECQTTQAKCLFNLISEYGCHAAIRIGVTGTIPKGQVNQTMLFVTLGSVVHTVTADELIKKGWLATPNIIIHQIKDYEMLDCDHPFKRINYEHSTEMQYLRSEPTRLQKILDILDTIKSSGNTLCLVSSVTFGKKLKKMMHDDVHFIYGKDDEQTRKDAYDLFETSDNLLVLATAQVAGVGISIDRIFNLVYIDAGKSYVRVIQAIGRGLRKGHDKDSVVIHDICSNLKYSKKHLRERLSYYSAANYPHTKQSINLKS